MIDTDDLTPDDIDFRNYIMWLRAAAIIAERDAAANVPGAYMAARATTDALDHHGFYLGDDDELCELWVCPDCGAEGREEAGR